MNKLRKHKIDEILNYLEKQAVQTELNKEAVTENITFFQHAYTLFSFYKWLYTKAPKIKAENLLELMDIDSNSPYDTELISSLAATERKFFPGMINPLVRKIFHLISDENCSLIANIGSGAMEVERQVIKKLINSGNKKKLVFIGIDKSASARSFAKENLSTLSNIEIIDRVELNEDSLSTILLDSKSLYTVVLCNNDIFSLDKYFTKTQFDLAFNCYFKHHFTANASQNIDSILRKCSKRFIEYDGLNSGFNNFVQSFFVWKNPVLLSGTIFSNLRYMKKNELPKKSRDLKIKTFWMKGTYLKETSLSNMTN